jgi:hypothetical protein
LLAILEPVRGVTAQKVFASQKFSLFTVRGASK